MATLTDTRVRNLKPGKTVKEVADPSSAGLRLRVTPTGKKVWFYRYRDTDSNLQKITLGHYPNMGLADARTAQDELAKPRRQKQDPKVAVAAEVARNQAEDKATALANADATPVMTLRLQHQHVFTR